MDGDDILTPSHFVTMNPRLGMPTISIIDDDDDDYDEQQRSAQMFVETYRTGATILASFWKLGQTGYLSSLRERGSYRLQRKEVPWNASHVQVILYW